MLSWAIYVLHNEINWRSAICRAGHFPQVIWKFLLRTVNEPLCRRQLTNDAKLRRGFAKWRYPKMDGL